MTLDEVASAFIEASTNAGLKKVCVMVSSLSLDVYRFSLIASNPVSTGPDDIFLTYTNDIEVDCVDSLKRCAVRVARFVVSSIPTIH